MYLSTGELFRMRPLMDCSNQALAIGPSGLNVKVMHVNMSVMDSESERILRQELKEGAYILDTLKLHEANTALRKHMEVGMMDTKSTLDTFMVDTREVLVGVNENQKWNWILGGIGTIVAAILMAWGIIKLRRKCCKKKARENVYELEE